jgi:cyclopropane fatty-acyl-phospholipid synthase-like methyltransferase
MGIFEDKYTKEYFTGKSPNGDDLNYGVTKFLDERGEYIIRPYDEAILKKINFTDNRVLCLGCGRGEELVYAVNHGASFCVGVDFSQNAIDIAQELFNAKLSYKL